MPKFEIDHYVYVVTCNLEDDDFFIFQNAQKAQEFANQKSEPGKVYQVDPQPVYKVE